MTNLPDIPTRIVLAPMAGGLDTPELVAAVGRAGGFGFLPSGYLSADRLRADLARVRALSEVSPDVRAGDGGGDGAGFGVNLFVPAPPDAERTRRAEAYAEHLRVWAGSRDVTVEAPAYTDDDYPAKVALLLEERPSVVSFTFGLPEAAVVDAFHEARIAVVITVTSPQEALATVAGGADTLAAQGWEAGAHQGGWLPNDEHWGLLPLLQAVLDQVDVPVMAAGGIATGRAVAAVLTLGAHAAMLGTAFMNCPEAGTSPAHAAALMTQTPTMMTRAFTGRPARSLSNAFARRFDRDAPDAYPEVHVATSGMRGQARARSNLDGFHLWAGQSHALTRSVPAADLVAALDTEARAARKGGATSTDKTPE